MEEQIRQSKLSLQQKSQAHRDEENGIRKRKQKIEAEVQNWIRKYDIDMDEKQTEVDDISVMNVILLIK